MARNKRYCEKHGYEHIFIDTSDIDVPPYWQKAFIAQNNLDKYKGILWLDTDATIFNMDITLDDVTSNSGSFYKSINSRGNQIFNAGVWIVKNSERGRKILDDWIKQYKASNWKKNGNKWHTNGPWAGKAYEQGSFAYKIVPMYSRNIKTLPENKLQSTDYGDPDTFILHLYNDNRSKIPEFLEAFPEPNR